MADSVLAAFLTKKIDPLKVFIKKRIPGCSFSSLKKKRKNIKVHKLRDHINITPSPPRKKID